MTNEIKTLEGTLRLTTKGFGFLKQEVKTDNDIRIEAEFLNTGMNNDKVQVVLLPTSTKDAPLGKVIKIVARAKMSFVGVLKKSEYGKDFFLIPDDNKMYARIIIPSEKNLDAKTEQKVLVEITKWENAKEDPQGEVIEVLGQAGDNNVEMRSIVLDKGMSIEFPKKVEEEAQAMHSSEKEVIKRELEHRRDFRDVTTFTIDPASAKDLDDALSFQELPDGNIEVGIHIADVTGYVKDGSEIDKEAKKRATSIYLVDRTIPMLPSVLSDDICSLKADVERLAFSAVFTFNKESIQEGGKLEILDQWFGETIIKSDKRFAYEDAQKIMDDGEGLFCDELTKLNSISYKLRELKFKAGAISLETDEVKFVLDKNGVPIDVVRKHRKDIHKMIEDFMLLANKKIAEYASKKIDNKEGKFIYRIHPKPEADRISNLIELLRNLGYNLSMKNGGVSSSDMNDVILKAQGTAEESLIQTATIRSMAKAVYSTKNVGHFGLAFRHYTHFTSPIRRYPDTMVHRLIKLYLKNKKPSDVMLAEYNTLSNHSSEQEQVATRAERDSVKYKQVEYMTKRVGETYDGTISGIAKWGIYVEENHSKSEGMISLRSMNDDFYEFDEKALTITGRKHGKKYRLGDTVKIKVKSADMEKKMIDYVFA